MKKFNAKLIGCLVSLVGGFLFVVLGNKNKYCLSFGFMLIGVALALYAMFKAQQIDLTIMDYNAQQEETDDEYVQQQLQLAIRKLAKQRKRVALAFYLCAALLVILGFANMF